MSEVPVSAVPVPAAVPARCALVTPAWIMVGFGRTLGGALAAGEGRLAFLSEDGPVFDVPVPKVTAVTWPWHWFGGGVTLRAAGSPYKITFILPQGAADVSPSLLDGGLALVAASPGLLPGHSLAGFLDIRRGREAARRWKEVLPAA